MLGVIFHWDHKQGLEAAGQRVLFQTMDYALRAYRPDLIVVVDEDSTFTLGVPDNIMYVTSLQVALDLFPGYTPVYLDKTPGAVNLATFSHPADAVYVIGRDFGAMDVPPGALVVQIEYPGEEMVLWASVAAGITLYDRRSKGL
jgi:hypothetical protein